MIFKKNNKKFLFLIPTSLIFLSLCFYSYYPFQESKKSLGCFGEAVQAQVECGRADLGPCVPYSLATATLIWEPYPECTNYRVLYGPSCERGLPGATVVDVGASTSYTVSNLLYNFTYCWAVVCTSHNVETEIFTFVTPNCFQCPAGTTCYHTILPGYCVYGTCFYEYWLNAYCIAPCPPPNNPPRPTNLQITNCDWCTTPFQFRLSWTFSDPDGDSQAAKQIQISPYSDFRQITFDSGKVENNIPAYTIPATGSGLEYGGKSYYWRVKVWDSRGGESSWISAPSSQNLVTPLHAYPTPEFSWSPASPQEDQEIQFFDQSTAYGNTIITRRSWIFNPDGRPRSSSQENPKVTFPTPGSKRISLTVWDSDNYSCSLEKEINVSVFAPIWREIIPW